MTNREYVLESLADGGDYGECEMQIKEFFEFVKIEITIEEFRKLINEMLDEGLICINEKWTNEFGEKPYTMIDKDREIWSKSNKN